MTGLYLAINIIFIIVFIFITFVILMYYGSNISETLYTDLVYLLAVSTICVVIFNISTHDDANFKHVVGTNVIGII